MTGPERIMRDSIARRLPADQTAMRLDCAAFIAGLVGEVPRAEAVVWHRFVGGVRVEVVAG